MKNENKDLYYLHDLSDYKVAEDYPDVKGWILQDASHREIGKVDGLLVSKAAERVVYLDIEVNADLIKEGHEAYGESSDGVHEFLNKDGEDHLIVPIGLVDIDEDAKIVFSNSVDYRTFSATNRFSKENNITRDYELGVYKTYFPEEDKSMADDLYDRNGFKRR
ncbi:MAG TPA: photosystem reaction center subunit H [Pelobium sp.]|nr:photosystem reaction center subunit H [Pelobium sp.]